MLPSRSAIGLVSLAVFLTSLTACANSPNSNNLERILAADPRLQVNPVFGNPNNRNQQTEANPQLPDDFPTQIPIYPNAELKEVTPPTNLGSAVDNRADSVGESGEARWTTSAPINAVQSFYQNQFQENNWEILTQPTDEDGSFEARLNNDLKVTVSIQPASAAISSDNSAPPSPNQLAIGQDSEVATEFVIQYDRNTTETASQPLGSQATEPQPGDPNFVGPTMPSDFGIEPTPSPDTETAIAPNGSQVFTDLNKAPQELRQYIEESAALGVLPLESSAAKSNQPQPFEPSKTVSRREYARWLVAANNAIHANSPAKQIRAAAETTQPAFQDVPRTDPDFAVIQGLAEAGLIPSPLSGDSTTVLFRPDAPLTREQLILWKVPIDIRQALPNASVDAVKETWGFQDAARIEPKALRAVLADFQNGDQSNIRRVFGYTTLFQPKKPVNRGEAATALWYFGNAGEGISAQEVLKLKTQQSQPSATSEPVQSTATNQEGSGE